MSYLLRTLLILALGVVPIALMGCPAEDDADDDDSAAGDDDDATADDDDATGDDDDTTPPLPTSMVATLEYNDIIDGVPACDMTVDLTGTKYTGYCDGCDFSFDVDGTRTDDQSTDECEQVPYYTWYHDGGPIIPWLMVHWDTYQTDNGSYSNVLFSGYSADYTADGGGYFPGPYFNVLHFDETTADTSFTRTGDDIEWTLNTTNMRYLSNYAYDCGSSVGSYTSYAYAGDYEETEDVACDAASADVWTFQAVAGETYSITVDTVASATAFDPTFRVNEPGGCFFAYADDNFDCTFPPPTFACPSYVIENATEGEYQVVVFENTYDTSECVDGTIGEYVIRIDATEEPVLTLSADDAQTYSEVDISVAMTGTITP
jgi:hypothetical protein